MNEPDKNNPKGLDSLFRPPKRCEVCEKNDDEDLYIIFNILYRVLVGDVFYQGSLKDDMSYDLEVLQEERPKQVPEESKSSEEKMRVFQQNVSREILSEIISSPQFDQLIREIFKSKYSRIPETNCKHEELAKHFIQSFNVSDHKNLQAMNGNREKTIQNADRLDTLLASICQLKDNIQQYHSEINKLSNHIISRLFNSQTHSQTREKSQENGKPENNLETLRVKKSNPLGKTRSSRANTNADDSTAPSSDPSGGSGGNGSNGNGGGNNSSSNQANESSSNGNSENSTDSTSNNNNGDNNNKKRSKAALPFKSKLPKKATDILKRWFLNNINSPYPSHEAKESLSKATGLTRKQIQNWFTNSRKRFWEPSKKKIEVKKSGENSPRDSMIVEENMDLQPKPNIIEPVIPQPNPEPINNMPQNVQNKPILQFIAPQFQNVVSPSIIKPVSPVTPQRFQMAPNQMQNPTIVYQGMIPQGMIPQGMIPQQLMQNGNNIVIVPYFVSQAPPSMAYSYRPPDMVPINGPFMQFPQGNMNMQVMEQQPQMMQNNGMGNSCFIPFQPNVVDMRNNGQNFNTINNNVYNNINNLGTIGNMGPIGNPGPIGPFNGFNNMPNVPNMTNMTNINPGFNPIIEKQPMMQMMPNMMNNNRGNQNDLQNIQMMGSPRSWQQKNMNGNIHHMKPELDDMNHQGRKHLHKDLNPENNTN